MAGHAIMDNLYTLFWVFVIILAFLLVGGVYENMDKIRGVLKLKRNARYKHRKINRRHAQAGAVFSRTTFM